MKVKQLQIDKDNNQKINANPDELSADDVNLVLAFAQRTFLEQILPYKKLKDDIGLATDWSGISSSIGFSLWSKNAS